MSDIRVLLVDDQVIVRKGIGVLLAYAEGIRVIGEAENGEQAIAVSRALQPDVVLMDLIMPVLGGIPATRRSLAERPDTRVIILTTYDADDFVFEGIRAGAQGYLLKDASSEELIEAIRRVHAGESRLDGRVASRVLGEFRRLAIAGRSTPAGGHDATPTIVLEPLSDREQEVLELLAQGLTNREIADTIHLAEGTIKNYVSTIIAKLQANDRTQAVITALRRGLVDL